MAEKSGQRAAFGKHVDDFLAAVFRQEQAQLAAAVRGPVFVVLRGLPEEIAI